MPVIYCAVARGAAVLAEYSVFAGNFNAVAKDYLGKASNAGRSSYTVDNHVFSFLADGGYSERPDEAGLLVPGLACGGAGFGGVLLGHARSRCPRDPGCGQACCSSRKRYNPDAASVSAAADALGSPRPACAPSKQRRQPGRCSGPGESLPSPHPPPPRPPPSRLYRLCGCDRRGGGPHDPQRLFGPPQGGLCHPVSLPETLQTLGPEPLAEGAAGACCWAACCCGRAGSAGGGGGSLPSRVWIWHNEPWASLGKTLRGRSYGDKGLSVKEGGLSSYAKKLKELMEHATQFPEEYSKVAGVQKKVRGRPGRERFDPSA